MQQNIKIFLFSLGLKVPLIVSINFLLLITINSIFLIFLTKWYSVFPIIHVIFVIGECTCRVFMIGIICVMSPMDDNLMIQIDFNELMDLDII